MYDTSNFKTHTSIGPCPCSQRDWSSSINSNLRNKNEQPRVCPDRDSAVTESSAVVLVTGSHSKRFYQKGPDATSPLRRHAYRSLRSVRVAERHSPGPPARSEAPARRPEAKRRPASPKRSAGPPARVPARRTEATTRACAARRAGRGAARRCRAAATKR